jgi:diguanylate cyclase (GGDEF)-like protein/PAS domain S-box-containing protein
MVGQSLLKLFPPDRVDEEQFIMHKISSGHRIDHFETVRVGKNGLPIDVSVTMSPIFDQAGKVIGASKIARNITERKLAEEKLLLSSSVFAHAWEGILITTTDGTIVDTNDAFSRITGYSRDEVLGKNPRILSSGLQNHAFYVDLWNSLIDKGHWYGEVWNRRKSGEMYAIVETISVVNDAQGIPRHYVAMLTDITRLKEHENELEHIAHYDPLTNLPNRILLADRMRQGITQVRRRNQSMAVVFLDLDGFKAINDKNGHEAGDRLLMSIASRMLQALREGDTFARIGGDEFVAVLLDLDNEDTAVQLLNRLLAAAFEPVQLADITLQVTASLGVAFYPQQEDIDADQLLRQADQAMYQAKLAGKNRYHVYDAALDHSIRTRNESLDRFRVAMIEQEFMLYYQPKVNMRTGVIIGAEALIRWNQPGKGLLLPALFLPEIEDHPLAIELGEWVIDTALTQVELWRSQRFDIQVSVNVGARQLQQSNFVTRLCEILAAHPDIMPSYLELEVLETSALEDIAKASLLIENCRKLGVSFALDDFGTGYSSLTYLKRLAVKVLKIDQSFVRDMLDDSDDLAIIEAVVGLGRTFHRQVVAEGVETVEHGTVLLQLGCELAQGYGIARPMPADQLLRWAMTWRPDPAWTVQHLR